MSGRVSGIIKSVTCLILIAAAGYILAQVQINWLGLGQVAFRHPGLNIRNSWQGPDELSSQAAAQAVGDLAMLGADADGGRLDARGGRWATLILTEPLLPGTGAGNNLKWGDLGRSAPGNRAEFSSAAAQAFREYVQLNSPALRIDPGELGASGKTTVLRGGALVQIQVPREYDGIPVRDSYLHAVINHGNLVLFGTSKWGDINLSTSPDVFFDDALAVVQAQVEPYTIDGFWGNSGLFIVPLAQGSDVNQIGVDLGYTHRLAWMMRPVFQGEPGNYEALVDAHSGELLSFGDTNDTTQNTSESVAGLISAVAGIAEAQLESGSVSVGGTAVTVNLTNTYATPVVVTTLQYSSSTTPAVTRVSNVTSSSFDVRLQNPSGGSVATENVSYLVVEEGTWTVDGHLVEAQIYTSTVTDEDGSWVGEVQGYNQSYTNPVVLGQVMSENDAGFSVFWDQGSVRENPPSATDLTTGKTVAEDTTVARLDETVGFIVFEKGNGTIGGVAFEAALGADTVGGVGDSPPYTYTFNTPFGSSPSVALLTMAGVDGFNGAWAQVHGATLATTTSLFLSVDEDQILDAERAHTTEQIGYVVFETPMLFPPCVNDGDCADGLFCNGAETCDPTGICLAGTPVDCDDAVGCTDDSCNEATDSCDNDTNDALCDNGLFCDGSETCDLNNDCQAGSDPCSGQSCDEGTDSCFNCVTDPDCADGQFCNGVEICVAGACQAGPPVDCDDGVACTDDSCDEGADSCGNVANDGLCDNGQFCDGSETCDVNNDCQAGSDPCDDGVGCTDDSCDEGADSCGNVANNGLCDNGQFCDGSETCGVNNDCQAGTPPICDDGIPCTADSCNEGTDSCDNVTNDAVCDDGAFCNGSETCSAVVGCQAGTSVDCDDGVGCTDDSCNETTDSCDNVTNDSNCDDALFCNGSETCDINNDCQAGSAACEGQSCDEGTDTCSGAAQIEWGSVSSVGGSAVTVNLTNTYVSAVVVTTLQYSSSTNPTVTRVSNVTATSFDVRLQNPSGTAVATENVSYVVVEEGFWTINGVAVEAQTYTSTVTDNDASWVGQVQSYLQSYTNPVVLGQVMTENDADFSVFWDQGVLRTDPPAAALTTGKTVAEDSDLVRLDETVGFIVFEAAHGTMGGVEFEAALGAGIVEGVDNSPPFTYTFNTPFALSPSIAVLTMAGVDGFNGGWAQVHGATLADTTSLFLSVDEDQIADTERAHAAEQVGYLVFQAAGSFMYLP